MFNGVELIMEKKEIVDKVVNYGGRMLLYGGTAASLMLGACAARDYFTGQFLIPQIYAGQSQPQILAKIMKNYSLPSLQMAYEHAKYLAAKAATGLISLGAIGLVIGLGKDWNSIKNFVGQVPNKFSSKLISPIKERVLRRNTGYMDAMGYSGI